MSGVEWGEMGRGVGGRLRVEGHRQECLCHKEVQQIKHALRSTPLSFRGEALKLTDLVAP
jgi:hypothetical protein